MLDWIVDGIRMLLWGLASACLELMDICYDLVVKLASADFLKGDAVWSWYYVFMLFLGVLVMARLISVYLKFCFDEEFRDKLSVSGLMHKLVEIGLVVALLPMALGFISNVSLWGINNINMFIGTQASSKPSTFIVTSFMNTDNGEFTEDGKWVEGKKITYTIDDIDINEEGEGDDDYKFFNSIADLFIIVFIGVAASLMLIINGLQIGKRMYSIVMKVLISPIPISSLIIPGDETFSMWRKMIVSDYCLNFLQTYMIIIVMILSGSKIVQQFGVWVQIISFLAGLLLLLSGIPELAKIIGGDTSQASVLQQVASFRLATRGFGHSMASGASSLLGTAGSGVAAIGYGGGRMLGGQSINSFEKASNETNSNGFMGGSSVNENTTGYNANESQYHAMNNQKDANTQQESVHTSTDIHGQNADNSNIMQNSRSSREGTKARRFSDVAQNMSGIKGSSARFVSNASSHMYQASMKRIQNNRIYKSAGTMHQMTMKRNFNNKGGVGDGRKE